MNHNNTEMTTSARRLNPHIVTSNNSITEGSDLIKTQNNSDLRADIKLQYGGVPYENYESTTKPILILNIQLSPDTSEQLVVFAGETAEQVATKFGEKVGLDQYVCSLLQEQISLNLSQISQQTQK